MNLKIYSYAALFGDKKNANKNIRMKIVEQSNASTSFLLEFLI